MQASPRDHQRLAWSLRPELRSHARRRYGRAAWRAIQSALVSASGQALFVKSIFDASRACGETDGGNKCEGGQSSSNCVAVCSSSPCGKALAASAGTGHPGTVAKAEVSAEPGSRSPAGNGAKPGSTGRSGGRDTGGGGRARSSGRDGGGGKAGGSTGVGGHDRGSFGHGY